MSSHLIPSCCEGRSEFSLHQTTTLNKVMIGFLVYSFQADRENVRMLYKRYLRSEIMCNELRAKKLRREIKLLDRQLDVSVSNYLPQVFVSCAMNCNCTAISDLCFHLQGDK